MANKHVTIHTAREMRLIQIARRFFSGPPTSHEYSAAVTEQMLRLGVIDRIPNYIESFSDVTRFEVEAVLAW